MQCHRHPLQVGSTPRAGYRPNRCGFGQGQIGCARQSQRRLARKPGHWDDVQSYVGSALMERDLISRTGAEVLRLPGGLGFSICQKVHQHPATFCQNVSPSRRQRYRWQAVGYCALTTSTVRQVRSQDGGSYAGRRLAAGQAINPSVDPRPQRTQVVIFNSLGAEMGPWMRALNPALCSLSNGLSLHLVGLAGPVRCCGKSVDCCCYDLCAPLFHQLRIADLEVRHPFGMAAFDSAAILRSTPQAVSHRLCSGSKNRGMSD